MARVCASCRKGPQVAQLVSHANNKVKRWVFPNVHRMRFSLLQDPFKKVRQGKVCTKCVKGGKVIKVL
jgi:large subunit ribosomal protein L28